MPITEIHGRLIETPTYPYLLLSARLRRPGALVSLLHRWIWRVPQVQSCI